MFLVFGL